MKKSNPNNFESVDPAMPVLSEWLDGGSIDVGQCEAARAELASISEFSQQTGQPDLEQLSQLFQSLLVLADCQAADGDEGQESARKILEFIQAKTALLFDTIACEHDAGEVDQAIQQARQTWGEHLQLLGDQPDSQAHDPPFEPDSNADEAAPPSTQQIDAMLAVIGKDNESAKPKTVKKTAKKASPEKSKSDKNDTDFSESTDELPNPPSELGLSSEVLSDDELREAYLDDANRCLGAMEQVVLDAEGSPDPESCVLEFCRQLHTLKGASASVGLSELANYLHEVEEWMSKHNSSIDIELLLTAVDSVRVQIGVIENPDRKPEPAETKTRSKSKAKSNPKARPTAQSAQPPSSKRNDFSQAAAGEASVRVRASQLDKLMDMLAELIVLRNQRDSQVGQLNALNDELVRCSNRLGHFREEQLEMMRTQYVPEQNAMLMVKNGTGSYIGSEPTTSNAVAEITNDLSEISRGIKDIYKPIAEENQALSSFIRHFRQELIQLRRVPLVGLFQKLQRSARDAARVEDRKIQVKLVGQNIGLEQTLQEQLFDPMLHLVRNAVGHGIEDEETRSKNGKNPTGTVTIEAKSTANLLVISIKDDGKGLDYDALRRRGYERGLLSPDRSPSTRELANLIFHPGFSTRDKASEVAGRGIGMDVVAGAINQLQGRIEIDSHPGSGTTMRVSVPLKSGIEHAMIFRAGGQLFALPMQSVTSAQKRNGTQGGNPDSDSLQHLRISLENGLKSCQPSSGQPQLLLDCSENEQGPQVALVVDEIVGPEEVVVRSLPRSLFDHPFLNGLTLSGDCEVVLFIDGNRIVDRAEFPDAEGLPDNHANLESIDSNFEETATASSRRALVVDDSLSARKVLVKHLRRRGYQTEEAGDGVEALEMIRRFKYDLLATDLDMPRLSGMDLLADIHENNSINVTTIVVSNRNQKEIRQRAAQLGALAFVNKPVTDDVLDDVLNEIYQAK